MLLSHCPLSKTKIQKQPGLKLEPHPLFQCYLSLSVWCMYVLFIHTIFISVICVSQEELSLIASNEQMYDFCKWLIFKKKRHWKVNFWYHWTIQCNTDICCEHMADGLMIYLCGCVSLLVWVTKVSSLDIYRSIISLSEITHQMRHDHPFSQRKKTSKIAVEVRVGGNGEEELEKILIIWDREYWGVFIT